MQCDVCGKQVEPSGREGEQIGPHVALTIDFASAMAADNLSKAYRGYLQEQFAPYRVRQEVHVCVGCFLKALGVPIDEISQSQEG